MKAMREIAEENRRRLAERDYVSQVRERFDFARALPRRGRRTKLALTAGAAIAILAVGGALVLLAWPSSLSMTVEGENAGSAQSAIVAAPNDSSLTVRFSDRSSIALEAGSQMRVARLDAKGASIVLERGIAEVKITDKPQAIWELSAGPFDVLVTGTRFTLHWDPEAEIFELALTQGGVRLNGPLLDDGLRLTPGKRLIACVPARRLEISSTSDDEPQAKEAATEPSPLHPDGEHSTEPSVECIGKTDSAQGSQALPVEPPSRNRAPVSRATPTWRDLLKQGKLHQAIASAEAAGMGQILTTSTPAELMKLGAAARLTGRWGRSKEIYLTARERFPGTEQASTAAFELGRIAFDHKRAFALSASWLETFLRERPASALAREALGRLMEAYHRQGKAEQALAVAHRYLARYPRGPHAQFAQTLVGKSGTQ